MPGGRNTLGVAVTAIATGVGSDSLGFASCFPCDLRAIAVAADFTKGDLQIVQLAIYIPGFQSAIAQIAECKIGNQRIAGHIQLVIKTVDRSFQLEICDLENTVDPQAEGTFSTDRIVGIGQLQLIVCLQKHIRGSIIVIAVAVQIIRNGEVAFFGMPQRPVAHGIPLVLAEQKACGSVGQCAVLPLDAPIPGGIQLNGFLQLKLQSLGIEIAVFNAVAASQCGIHKRI